MKKMKNIIALALTIVAVSIVSGQKLTKKWELSGLEAPESVLLYDEFYYVSNVSGQPAEKNGKGFISKVTETGEVEELKWAVGFNGPKGLGVHQNILFVADIDVVKSVDLATGQILKTYKAEGATFLNDVEMDSDGTIYISDTFGGNAIYMIKNDEISIFIKDDRLDYPNGLKIKENDLYVASWGVVTDPSTFATDTPGKLIKLDLATKEMTDVSSPTGNLDGLVSYEKGFLTSDWIAGGIKFISNKGESKDILDLNAGSADIYFQESNSTLLVPQMIDGKLVAYTVE